ncbi:hypothetical protein NXS08_03885 [Gleimia sp. 6138-11-ORH1]|uniref:hypothetical protein n=1 Tax=Gleimia sp. 6138-11-ORH1 TaxID=2973937 RepID=UPI00216976F2|nr:hypothetical protein [Gleimia sp. 6138-11-ORH1]MCS4484629.1 hypothetical protein [Gleimia sp. 6138-11-ORH1]
MAYSTSLSLLPEGVLGRNSNCPAPLPALSHLNADKPNPAHPPQGVNAPDFSSF